MFLCTERTISEAGQSVQHNLSRFSVATIIRIFRDFSFGLLNVFCVELSRLPHQGGRKNLPVVTQTCCLDKAGYATPEVIIQNNFPLNDCLILPKESGSVKVGRKFGSVFKNEKISGFEKCDLAILKNCNKMSLQFYCLDLCHCQTPK